MQNVKNYLPLLIIVLGIGILFVFDLGAYLSLDALAKHRAWLESMLLQHPVLLPLAYIGIYLVVVVFSLPGGLVMTLAGGFLFGAWLGALYAVLGATVGAVLLFLAAKTSLGDMLQARVGGALKWMQQGFRNHAMSYMFVLRLVPLFPFWLVNLAPAFLGVPLRTYVIATFFGMMPGTFVFALAGAGLGSVLEQGEPISVAGVLTPQVIGALCGLALLSLIPVLMKHFRPQVITPEEEVSNVRD